MNNMTEHERAEFHKAKHKALAGQATAKHAMKLSAKLSTALNERNEARAKIERLREALNGIKINAGNAEYVYSMAKQALDA